jgi:uncharacterized tellurite resistance protein B-like protein
MQMQTTSARDATLLVRAMTLVGGADRVNDPRETKLITQILGTLPDFRGYDALKLLEASRSVPMNDAAFRPLSPLLARKAFVLASEVAFADGKFDVNGAEGQTLGWIAKTFFILDSLKQDVWSTLAAKHHVGTLDPEVARLLAQAMLLVIGSDGKTTERELAILRAQCKTVPELRDGDADAILRAAAARVSAAGMGAVQDLATLPGLTRKAFALAAEVAHADGAVSPAAMNVLRAIQQTLGLDVAFCTGAMVTFQTKYAGEGNAGA